MADPTCVIVLSNGTNIESPVEPAAINAAIGRAKMPLVQLTDIDDLPHYVNPAHIVQIEMWTDSVVDLG
jgi:hypothetical protein